MEFDAEPEWRFDLDKDRVDPGVFAQLVADMEPSPADSDVFAQLLADMEPSPAQQYSWGEAYSGIGAGVSPASNWEALGLRHPMDMSEKVDDAFFAGLQDMDESTGTPPLPLETYVDVPGAEQEKEKEQELKKDDVVVHAAPEPAPAPKRKYTRKKTVTATGNGAAGPASLRQAWPPREQFQYYAKKEVDKSYELVQDLKIIKALRQFLPIPSEPNVFIPMPPVIDMAAELAGWNVRVGPKTENNHFHGVSPRNKGAVFSAAVTGPELIRPGGNKYESIYVGEYAAKESAARAADAFKVKLKLIGQKRCPKARPDTPELLNFPVADYHAHMALPQVRFITDYHSYAEHLLTVHNRADILSARHHVLPHLRGVYDLKPELRSPNGPRYSARVYVSSRGKNSTKLNKAADPDAPTKGKWMVVEGGEAHTVEEAAMAYDRHLVRTGLFLRPGALHHIPNFPLSNYVSEILAFAEKEAADPELGKSTADLRRLRTKVEALARSLDASPSEKC